MQSPERALYEKRVNDVLREGKREQKIVRYFPETHLGNGHQGLMKLADKVGINCKNLNKGEYVVFVNRDQTAVKLFAPGNVVAHLKMPGSQRLDPRIISLIPRFFNGSRINYDSALEEVLRKEFKK